MSQRRKHVTQAILNQQVEPPGEGQRIVRALGSRGSNIVEVELADGQQTLCMMPAKFNKKLWVKRGGYLIINESQEAQQDSNTSITGTISAVLYDDHIKALKRMPGVWPAEFEDAVQEAPSSSTAAEADDVGPSPSRGNDDDDDSSSDDGLPPLEGNPNRRVIYHEVSESDEDEEEQEQQQQPMAWQRHKPVPGAAGS